MSSILSRVNAEVDDDETLQLALGPVQLSRLCEYTRTVYVDRYGACVVKAEHSICMEHDCFEEPYQCWNEYVFWTERVADTPYARLFVPTLELSVIPCPIPDHQARGCVVTLALQEYIDSGYQRVEVGDPWLDCMREALETFSGLGRDMNRERVDQVVYSHERGRHVIVDYGTHEWPGKRLHSHRHSGGYWAWVRSVLPFADQR